MARGLEREAVVETLIADDGLLVLMATFTIFGVLLCCWFRFRDGKTR